MVSIAGSLTRARAFRHHGLLWLLLAGVSFVIVAPIALLTYNSFNEALPGQPFNPGLHHWREALDDPRLWPALWNTVRIVFVRMGIGFVVGVLLAWLITRTNIPHASWLDFGMWLSFFMPGLAVIQGWIFLLEGNTGVVNQWIVKLPFIDGSPFNVFSFWGIIWVHLMANVLSTHFVLFSLSFRNMDGALEEAARVAGATGAGTVRRITLPIMRPILGMVVVLAIIRGMQSFEVERVLGQPIGIDVYATLLVHMISDEDLIIEQAVVLSVIILMALVPLIFIQRYYVGNRMYTTVSGKMRPTTTDLGRWRWPAFAFVVVVIALLTIVPFIALIAGSLMTRWGYFDIQNVWTFSHYSTVLSDSRFLGAFWTTLKLGVISAFVGMAVMFAVAYALVRSSFRGKQMLDFVSWLPWALPGVLLSLGILMMVLQISMLQFLHGTSIILVVAIILFRFPIGVHLLRTGIMQVSNELEEAAQISGARWWYIQFRIVGPILMPMLLGVGLITFVATLNEVSGVILLASTTTKTLSLLTLDFLVGAGGSREAAAVITIVIMFMAIAAVGIGRRFGLKLAADR